MYSSKHWKNNFLNSFFVRIVQFIVEIFLTGFRRFFFIAYRFFFLLLVWGGTNYLFRIKTFQIYFIVREKTTTKDKEKERYKI